MGSRSLHGMGRKLTRPIRVYNRVYSSNKLLNFNRIEYKMILVIELLCVNRKRREEIKLITIKGDFCFNIDSKEIVFFSSFFLIDDFT